MDPSLVLYDYLLIIMTSCWSVGSISAIRCIDTVNVNREGNSGTGSSRQAIVPQKQFFCNGRVTGFLVSLHDYENDNQLNPYIQVWRRSRIDLDSFDTVGQYQLHDDEITQRSGYFLANVSLSGNDTILFQPGYVIGYYHPPSPRYRVNSVDVNGFTTYTTDSRSPLNSFNIKNADHVNSEKQPLIETSYDIQCTNLKTPLNGFIVLCNSGQTGVGYEGDTCSFTCNTGYELTSSNTRTCQSDGTWSGTESVCRRVSCPLLITPNNGNVNCGLRGDGLPSFQDICIITCNSGYELIGNETRTCQSDGSWSGNEENIICSAASIEEPTAEYSNLIEIAIITGVASLAIVLLIILPLTCLFFCHKRKKSQLANTAGASRLDIDSLNVNLQDNPSYLIAMKSCNDVNDDEYDDTINPTVYTQENLSSLINIENAMKLNCINSAYNGSTV